MAEDTRDRLLDAARAEFASAGFAGTNTNRIASRARVSPKTFYRHFDDKLAVFRVVYAAWIDESWRAITEASAAAPEGQVGAHVIATVEAHYAAAPALRASVRMLCTQEASFRDLYLAEGRRQIETTRGNRLGRGQVPRAVEEHIAGLIIVERFVDALVFDEVRDLGADPATFRALAAAFVDRYIGEGGLFGGVPLAARGGDRHATRRDEAGG